MVCKTLQLSDTGLPEGDALWPMLRRGKLGPLLYAGRLRFGEREAAEPWHRAFRVDYAASLGSHRVYRDAAAALLQALGVQRVPALLLRGTAVAERLYDDPGLRPYTDIDLLVPRAQLPEAKGVARDLGYHPPEGSLPDGFYERHHLHLRYIAPTTGVPLEIHWALDHPFSLLRVDFDDLFASALIDRLAGAPVLRPSDEDLLILLALHLAKHGTALRGAAPVAVLPRAARRGILLWMVDLHLLIAAHGRTMDWEAIARRLDAWEAVGAVGAVLSQVGAALGTGLPLGAERLAEAAPRAPILARAFAALAGGEARAARGFRALSGAMSRSPAFFGLERAADLPSFLYPPRRWVERHAPSPGSPVLLRRAAHTIHAARRLGRLAWDLGACFASRALPRPGGRRLAVPAAGGTPVQG